MPIVANDIEYRLSGGAANADPAASLGGAKSSTVYSSNTLFDDVPSTESVPGDIEYRCLYVHNNHGTLTLENAVLWLLTNTTSADTIIEVAVGNSAVNGTESAIANENTAPSPALTFTAAATEGAAIALGNIPAGQHRAVWFRRTVSAAAAASNDTFSWRVKGDTQA